MVGIVIFYIITITKHLHDACHFVFPRQYSAIFFLFADSIVLFSWQNTYSFVHLFNVNSSQWPIIIRIPSMERRLSGPGQSITSAVYGRRVVLHENIKFHEKLVLKVSILTTNIGIVINKFFNKKAGLFQHWQQRWLSNQLNELSVSIFQKFQISALIFPSRNYQKPRLISSSHKLPKIVGMEISQTDSAAKKKLNLVILIVGMNILLIYKLYTFK